MDDKHNKLPTSVGCLIWALILVLLAPVLGWIFVIVVGLIVL